jgi:hypothetical protein
MTLAVRDLDANTIQKVSLLNTFQILHICRDICCGLHFAQILTLCSLWYDGNGGVIQSPQFSAVNSQYELPKKVAIIMLQVTESFLPG